jgi:sporulation protein YlmC with PRC-barrel domain
MTTATRTTLSATTLIGDYVYNRSGEELGHIKDIMLDLRNGRIAYAVLSFGGIMGMGDRLFAIPWLALELHAETHSFVLDIDKERLKAAEGFDKDDWPDMADPDWGFRMHEFYDVRPYWD